MHTSKRLDKSIQGLRFRHAVKAHFGGKVRVTAILTAIRGWLR